MRWLSRCETQDRQLGSPAQVRQGQTQPALIAICKDTKRNNKIVRLSAWTGAWVNTAPAKYAKEKVAKNSNLILSPISYFPLLFHKCRFTCALSGFLLSIPFPISMDLLNFVANQNMCVKLFTKFAVAKTFDYFHFNHPLDTCTVVRELFWVVKQLWNAF